MAGEIGLVTHLGMDIGGFLVGLNSAMDAAKNFSKGVVAELNKGVTASLERVGNQFRVSGNYDLSTKQIQRMEFAAQQTGMQLQTMLIALRQSSKVAGDATFGGTASQNLFKRLGIDYKEFAMMDMEEKLHAIRKAFEGIHNQAQRSYFAQGLFFRNGIEMLQMLKELETNTAKFNRLNGGLGEKGAEDIYRWKQALSEVEIIFESIYNQIAAKIAPVITNVIHKMEDWGFTGTALKDKIDAVGHAFYVAAKYATAALWAGLVFLNEIRRGYAIVFQEIVKNLSYVADYWKQVFSKSGEWVKVAFDFWVNAGISAANGLIYAFTFWKNVVGGIFHEIKHYIQFSLTDSINELIGKINILGLGWAKLRGVNFTSIPSLPTHSGSDPYKPDKGPADITRKEIDDKLHYASLVLAELPAKLNAVLTGKNTLFGHAFNYAKNGFTQVIANFDEVLAKYFKGVDKARAKGPQDLEADAAAKAAKNTPGGYALNMTNTRASLEAMRLAFKPVQEVKDQGVIDAVKKVEEKMPDRPAQVAHSGGLHDYKNNRMPLDLWKENQKNIDVSKAAMDNLHSFISRHKPMVESAVGIAKSVAGELQSRGADKRSFANWDTIPAMRKRALDHAIAEEQKNMLMHNWLREGRNPGYNGGRKPPRPPADFDSSNPLTPVPMGYSIPAGVSPQDAARAADMKNWIQYKYDQEEKQLQVLQSIDKKMSGRATEAP